MKEMKNELRHVHNDGDLSTGSVMNGIADAILKCGPRDGMIEDKNKKDQTGFDAMHLQTPPSTIIEVDEMSLGDLTAHTADFHYMEREKNKASMQQLTHRALPVAFGGDGVCEALTPLKLSYIEKNRIKGVKGYRVQESLIDKYHTVEEDYFKEYGDLQSNTSMVNGVRHLETR
eukprot:CAMPEP_0171307246 /NCGR_PEP_ID=MMETSP0816-20121228/17258_1 /TAXON_ID=420281 /ORGANISM="Proboscia inermis, Strain CCAP1064/1" /LENGTH=173 /DNA_ID=CAMNT_0011789291 /DNA_START=30 /DNA_END=551 /DNA_ORIENTATION=+